MTCVRMCRTGSLAPAVETCKKGVLKVDLQAKSQPYAGKQITRWFESS